MDKTPKGKYLRFVKSDADTSLNDSAASTSTPVNENKKAKIWAGGGEDGGQGNNLDVVWDWDSPKNIKPKISRTKKQILKKSPKIKSKKASQTNFDKLREELQALRDEIAKGDEDCLPLSPLEEQIIKEETTVDNDEINKFIEEQYYHIENQDTKGEEFPKHDDWFDESCDEQLFLCSQMIEEKLHSNGQREIQNLHINIPINSNSEHKDIDDSFDAVMKEFKDEDIKLLTQNQNTTPRRANLNFKRTHSDANVEYVPKNNSRINIQRTFSFESPSTSNSEDLPSHIMEEIERKRNEALEKLKRKKENIKLVDVCNNSPCSVEEIEKKRLQAKAIREAKQLEIIEKNRKEALKRLEMNKLKRLDLSKKK